MFLHTNLSPKWNLRIPASSLDLKRRWEVLQPGGRPFREALALDSSSPSSSSSASSSSDAASAAVDLEGEVFDFLAALSCDAALQRYAEAMAARANALREREEAEERREDEALERLEAAEAPFGKGEEEEEGRGKRQRQQQRRREEEEEGGGGGGGEEKPAWRTRAEKRRAERLEEERRRDKELLRRRKAALAARASRRRHRTRRSGDEEEEEEETENDLSLLFLLDAEAGEPKKLPRVAPADLLPRGLPPSSFHPLNPGVDFAAAFRWGLRGTFEEFTPLGAFDWLLHFVNGGVRPAGRRVRRGLAFLARGGGGYFRPF